jgi:hypothetical protein
MNTNDFDAVPTQIIEAWARGEYYGGDPPSPSYNYIGITLALRGWYVYEAKEGDQVVVKGVVKIDFRGAELFIGGLRLYPNQGSPGRALFWVSEFANFLNENEVIWVYKVFASDAHTAWSSKYIDPIALNTAQSNVADLHFGLQSSAWNQLLDRIRTDLYDDLEEVQANNDRIRAPIVRGLLHFWVRERRAQYRQIYSPEDTGPLIGGEAIYTRVSKL